MVSNVNILDASGLFDNEIQAVVQAKEEEEEDIGDEYWDHNDDDLAALAQAADDVPNDVSQKVTMHSSFVVLIM